jgi:hypothetical protein
MKNLAGWARLTASVLACRDDLRALYPAVDLAARTGAMDAALVVRVRDFMLEHGQAFTAALKAPGGSRGRQPRNSDASWCSGGLWAIGKQGSKERKQC